LKRPIIYRPAHGGFINTPLQRGGTDGQTKSTVSTVYHRIPLAHSFCTLQFAFCIQLTPSPGNWYSRPTASNARRAGKADWFKTDVQSCEQQKPGRPFEIRTKPSGLPFLGVRKRTKLSF